MFGLIDNFSSCHLLADERRILKLLRRKGSIPVNAKNRPVVRRLVGHGFVSTPHQFVGGYRQYTGTCELCDLGKRYFIYLHDQRIQFWKDFFSRFLTGILVGVISTIVATWSLGLLRLNESHPTQPQALQTITINTLPTAAPNPSAKP